MYFSLMSRECTECFDEGSGQRDSALDVTDVVVEVVEDPSVWDV